MLFSIIIPVYNSENTLSDCLMSILKQTCASFEVLVVDNGSTDKSIQIAEHYSQIDDRIMLFRNSEKGVSATRNLGLDHAKGTYICFVDSDDKISETYLESFDCAFQHHADMIVCNYMIKQQNGCCSNKISIQYGVYDQQEYLRMMLRSPHDYYYGVVWNKCFQRTLIEQYHIRFDRTMNLAEDLNFVLQYLRYIKRVSVIDDLNYIYYRLTDTSLSNSCKKDPMMLFENYKKNHECLLALCSSDSMKSLIDGYLFSGFITCITNTISDNELLQPQVKELIIQIYKSLCNCNLMKVHYKSIYHKVLHILFRCNSLNMIICLVKLKTYYVNVRR